MDLPNLESLRCFAAAADELNFRLASERVALSPAAFGERIRQLEEHVGALLFDRSRRRVALTAAGLRLVPQAGRLLAEAGRCAEIARGEAGESPCEIRLGTRFELGLSWLVPSLPALAAAEPARTVHLVFGGGPELLRLLDHGQVDAVVTSARLNVAGAEYVKLHEEAYVLVGRPDLLRDRPLRRPQDAARHTLVDTAGDLPLFRYFLDASPRTEAWEFGRVEYLGTIGAIRLRLLQGAGLGVLPRYAIRADLAARRLVPAGPRRKLPSDWFRLVWSRGHALEPRLRALGQQLARRPLT